MNFCRGFETNFYIALGFRSASLLEIVFLRAIVADYEHTGTEEARLDRVITRTQETFLEEVPIGRGQIPDSVLLGLANRLAAMGLIFMESKATSRFVRRLSLGCSVDDVKFATRKPE